MTPRLIRFLFSAAIFWLVVGSALTLVAAIELVWPIALPACLAFGRIAPAAVNVLIYGWISSSALGIALWLLSRLGRVGLPRPALPTVAAIFWQIGVFVGLVGLLAGQGNAFLFLEFPLYAAVLLFLACLCLTAWGYSFFRIHVVAPLYASSWYLVAGLLAFPWLLATGYAFLVWRPVPGSAEGPIAAWLSGAMVNLWLAPMALACLYFLVASLTERRIVSYNFARPAFWSFIAIGAWTGLVQLLGGPIPAWLSATGAFAGQLLLIPVLLISVNLLSTLAAAGEALRSSLPLRYALFSAVSFLVVYFLGTLLSLPGLNGLFRFSDVTLAQGVLLVGGFVTPAFFGMIVHIRDSDPGRRLMRAHFWLLIVGVIVMFICFALGGVIQSFAQADPGLPFSASITYVRPFRFLGALGVLIFFASSICFAMGSSRRLKPW